MIKLNLKGEEEGTMIITDKKNALSKIIECMPKSEVHEITVEYGKSNYIEETTKWINTK